MDAGIIFKIVTALLGIIGVAKIIYEVSSGSKLRLREEYRFAKEFLKDLQQDKDIHPLTIEKGYYAIAGTNSINSKEIEYILTLENPDRCLKDYALSRQYLEHLKTSGNLQIDFAKKYKSNWSRRWRKTLHVAIYFLGSCIAVSPFILFKPLALESKQFLALIAITLPTFGFFAAESLRSFIKIHRGELLVKNQNKHTKRILINSFNNA
jgi:hypothetical protein